MNVAIHNFVGAWELSREQRTIFWEQLFMLLCIFQRLVSDILTRQDSPACR